MSSQGIEILQDAFYKLKHIKNKIRKVVNKMATGLEELQAYVAQIGDITTQMSTGITEVANDMQNMAEQLAGAATKEQVDAILAPKVAALQSIADNLTTLGQQQ